MIVYVLFIWLAFRLDDPFAAWVGVGMAAVILTGRVCYQVGKDAK